MHRHSVVVFAFAIMVVNLGNLRVKLKIQWNNFRRSVQPYFSYDYDRCLDLIILAAGMRPLTGPEPWKRSLWVLYRLLGFYQFIMSLAKVVYSLKDQDDLAGLFASILVTNSFITAALKVYSLEYNEEAIQNLKAFLRSNTGHSDDPDYDASVRRGTTRTVEKVTLAIYIMICCDQLVSWVPNSARDRVIGIPKQFQALGSMAACLLQGVYVSTCAYFWGSRYYCAVVTIMPILMGLQSELEIVAHGYETIEDRVKSLVLEDQNNATGPSRKLATDNEVARKHLKRFLGTSVEQHVEVLRNIQLVQPVVSQIYAITHYSTMIIVSMMVFLVIKSEVSPFWAVYALTGCILLLECYLWCQLTDSFEETMENIAEIVAQLGSRLEHSVDKHSEYIQMRTSLMIVQLNASRSELFSCGGFFPMSIESFGDLCMVVYRFATFLLDLD